MKILKIAGVLLVLSMALQLAGCGFVGNVVEEVRVEQAAKKLAVSYIKEKYGMKAKARSAIAGGYSVMFSSYIGSDAIVEMESKGKRFAVYLDTEDETVRYDNWQQDEIRERLNQYLLERYGLSKPLQAQINLYPYGNSFDVDITTGESVSIENSGLVNFYYNGQSAEELLELLPPVYITYEYAGEVLPLEEMEEQLLREIEGGNQNEMEWTIYNYRSREIYQEYAETPVYKNTSYQIKEELYYSGLSDRVTYMSYPMQQIGDYYFVVKSPLSEKDYTVTFASHRYDAWRLKEDDEPVSCRQITPMICVKFSDNPLFDRGSYNCVELYVEKKEGVRPARLTRKNENPNKQQYRVWDSDPEGGVWRLEFSKSEEETVEYCLVQVGEQESLAAVLPDKPSDSVVSWFLADMDQDLQDELLVITGGGRTKKLDTGEPYGDCLKIYTDFEIIDQKPVLKSPPDHEFDLSEIKPLKIQAGDINGDGVTELAVCVYKTAEFHPVLAKRPFFYDLKNGELEPVWLGSRLARPFEDYRLHDMDGDGLDEIVSVEFLENGNRVIAVYDWKGFGFEVKAVSDELEGEILFLNNTNSRQGDILVSAKGETRRLQLNEKQIEFSED